MTTQHPPIERLAELVDGVPTLFEREHVAGCSACAKELQAFERLASLARDERRRIAPPLTTWESLRGRLAAQALLTSPRPSLVVRRRHWMLRVASAVALVAGGVAAGRWSAAVPGAIVRSDRLTNGDLAAAATGAPRSADEALAQLQQAQRAYDEAATWLAAHDTSSARGTSDQYRTRLAALDMASSTFEQALTDAPVDPVLNQYFLATMNAREVAIRRLGTTLPASVRVGRF